MFKIQTAVLHQIWSVDSQQIIKAVATICHILRLKCTKFNFGWGSVEELTALPRPPNWI